MAFPATTFLTSAAQVRQLPEDSGCEVCFVGRSNAGKSSALNAICQNKIARVSKTPGRTQLMNVFSLDDVRRLVDLPGYGYAKVPGAMKDNWHQMVNRYLTSRQSLKALVLVMDSRHPLKPMDETIIAWTQAQQIHLLILLSKADKLSKSQCLSTLKLVREKVPFAQVQLFSALKKTGVLDAQALIIKWLE